MAMRFPSTTTEDEDVNTMTVWRSLIAIAILLVGCLFLTACGEGRSAPTYPPGGDDPIDTPVLPDGGDDDAGDGGTIGTSLGQIAPDFTLSDSNDLGHTLYDYRGKVVILYFWAEWCPYCEEQAPRMQDFQDTYPDDLKVLSLNLSDTAPVINAYMSEYDLSYPALMVTAAVQSVWGITMIPHAVVLDREGVVVYNAHPAYLTENTLGSHF